MKYLIPSAIKSSGAIGVAMLLLSSSLTAAESVSDKIYGSIAALEAVKAEYEKFAKKDAWGPIKSSKTLRLGSSGTAPEDLRKRLAAEGYKIKRSGINYDKKLEAAVKEFQLRHGLEPNGRADSFTYEALSVTPAERVQQIEANIKRRREHGERASTDAMILLNLPERRLHGASADGANLTMDISVAKTAWETPEMRSRIESVVVNPYWNVPLEVVDAELVWEVKNNPNYFTENGLEVVKGAGPTATMVAVDQVDWDAVEAEDPSRFPYLVRRKPGPENPMGLIKFVLGDSDDVFLHDSPLTQASDQRSSGAYGSIALENSQDLAAFIGSHTDGWSEADLQKALDSGNQETLKVDPSLEIDVVYWTAWVGADGNLNFRGDLHNRD